jgi:glycerophosphoryl diester phosphodiesterase
MAWLRIAHRGAAGTRPELTRPAFERALEIGVDMIELDVHLTRDQALVVLHDRELGRTVRGRGFVRDHTLADLTARDAGAWFGPDYAGTPVLALADVLDLTCDKAALNVEIKSPDVDWGATASALLELLMAKDRLEATIISSFEMGALQEVRTRSRSARLGVLWQNTELDPMWRAAEALQARSAHPHWSLVDASLVAEAHERDLAVIVWTVNDPLAMRRLAGLGVDGIISDYPERFSEAATMPQGAAACSPSDRGT